MTGGAHETPEFRNAVEYTVTVTFRVAGAARYAAGRRRAQRIAERIAASAARMAGVVEVTARGGQSSDGKASLTYPLRFEGANTGTAALGEPEKLDRYLDPDRERALQDLAAANRAHEDAHRRDRERRIALGCGEASPLTRGHHTCDCVYCRPQEHQHDAETLRRLGPSPYQPYRCPCSAAVDSLGGRCARHDRVQLVVLPGDPPALQRYVQQATPDRDAGGRDL